MIGGRKLKQRGKKKKQKECKNEWRTEEKGPARKEQRKKFEEQEGRIGRGKEHK